MIEYSIKGSGIPDLGDEDMVYHTIVDFRDGLHLTRLVEIDGYRVYLGQCVGKEAATALLLDASRLEERPMVTHKKMSLWDYSRMTLHMKRMAAVATGWSW